MFVLNIDIILSLVRWTSPEAIAFRKFTSASDVSVVFENLEQSIL